MNGSIQDSIGKLEKGFKGQQANSNPVKTSNEVAGAIVNVGTFARFDANGNIVSLSATGQTVAGLILKSDMHNVDSIEKGKNLTLGKEGDFYVYCETAITKGAKLFVRHTTNTTETVGDVRVDADTAKADEVAGIIAGETLTGAGLLKVEIKL